MTTFGVEITFDFGVGFFEVGEQAISKISSIIML